jgi:hypothetical protein
MKSSFFRAWSLLVIQDLSNYETLITETARAAAMKTMRIMLNGWWMRVKTIRRSHVMRQRRVFRIQKKVITLWRIHSFGAVSFRLNALATFACNRNRKLLVSIFSCLKQWNISAQRESRRKQIKRSGDRGIFQLSRVFRAFMLCCRNQLHEHRLHTRRCAINCSFQAWREKLQQIAVLECVRQLIEKMRIIRQVHAAIRCFKAKTIRRQQEHSLALFLDQFQEPDIKFLISTGTTNEQCTILKSLSGMENEVSLVFCDALLIIIFDQPFSHTSILICGIIRMRKMMATSTTILRNF